MKRFWKHDGEEKGNKKTGKEEKKQREATVMDLAIRVSARRSLLRLSEGK